jgi:hypothetical protein
MWQPTTLPQARQHSVDPTHGFAPFDVRFPVVQRSAHDFVRVTIERNRHLAEKLVFEIRSPTRLAGRRAAMATAVAGAGCP